jgi:hypothetical protein
MGSRKQGRLKHKNHAQDGGTLGDHVANPASGDPAMVSMSRMASILPMVRASRPLRPAAGLRLDVVAHDLLRKPEHHFSGSCIGAGIFWSAHDGRMIGANNRKTDLAGSCDNARDMPA